MQLSRPYGTKGYCPREQVIEGFALCSNCPHLRRQNSAFYEMLFENVPWKEKTDEFSPWKRRPPDFGAQFEISLLWPLASLGVLRELGAHAERPLCCRLLAHSCSSNFCIRTSAVMGLPGASLLRAGGGFPWYLRKTDLIWKMKALWIDAVRIISLCLCCNGT